MKIVGVPDKLLADWLKDKEYIVASDEGEAVGIGIGHWLSKQERATVFMSADGFCNALNPITSCVIPEGIEMNFMISTGRKEPHHVVMTNSLKKIIEAIEYDSAKLSFEFIEPDK